MGFFDLSYLVPLPDELFVFEFCEDAEPVDNTDDVVDAVEAAGLACRAAMAAA